jgi:hypothetical protein
VCTLPDRIVPLFIERNPPVSRALLLALAIALGVLPFGAHTARASVAGARLSSMVPAQSDLKALEHQFGRGMLTAGTFQQKQGAAVSGASLAKDSHVSMKEIQRDGFVAAYEVSYSNSNIKQKIHQVGGEALQLKTAAGAHRFLKNVVFSPYILGELSVYKVKFMGGIKGLGDESKWLRFVTSKTTENDIVTWRHGGTLLRVSVLGPLGTDTYKVMLAEAQRVNGRL